MSTSAKQSGAQGGSCAALDGLLSFLPVLFPSLRLLQHAYVRVFVCLFFCPPSQAQPATRCSFDLSSSLRCFQSISPLCGCVSKGGARPRADLSTLFIFGVSFNSQRLFSLLHKACFKARTSCACFAGVWMPVSGEVLWKNAFGLQLRNRIYLVMFGNYPIR